VNEKSKYLTGKNAWRQQAGESAVKSAASHLWPDRVNLHLLNLVYDLTPMEFVTVVLTEVGMIPATSVPAVVREYRKEAGGN